MKYHQDKASPLLADGAPIPHTVFVFFSNESGKISSTTDKLATQFGFKKPAVKGFCGNSYAIITKEADSTTLKPESEIAQSINALLSYALANPELEFFIQKPSKNEVPNEILAPMFSKMPANVSAPKCWSGWIDSLPSKVFVKRHCKTCSYREVRAKITPASLRPIAQCAKQSDGIWLGDNYLCKQYVEHV